MTTTLPDKPSELIRLSLADMEKAEASPLYEVSMLSWHTWSLMHHACLVCQAGAVMAFSLEANRREDYRPHDFGKENERKLIALDCFRTGHLDQALKLMEVSRPHNIPQSIFCDMPMYAANSRAFFLAQHNLADLLEAEGL